MNSIILGIDISKETFDVALLNNNKVKTKKFDNSYRVDAKVTLCAPHRTGLTDFPYPALRQELTYWLLVYVFRMR